jgi:multicomponent Na+:H+ antiporter subunit D
LIPLPASIHTQLPVLAVVMPLLTAPLCLLLGRRAWMLASLSALLSFGVAVSLLDQVLDEGMISYALGGWAAPWGIEYRLDPANAFVLLIVSGMAAITLPWSVKSVADEIPAGKIGQFYTLLMLCFAGLSGITVTGDAFNVFVFLEISSLSTYVLISMGRDRRALTASFQYLIMGTIGGTFFLIGVGLLYVITGTLNMADLAARLPEVTQLRTEHTAFAFIVVGIGLKLAMFPLHLWLPNAYAYAPSAATVFIAATATKVAVYTLLRFIFSIFGEGVAYQDLPFGQIAMVLAIAGMLTASTVAIFQGDVKRMLAYSSVAQIGYIVLGLSLDTVAGVTASLLHLFNHALMKAALFMAVALFFYRVGSMRLADLGGIGRKMPWTFAALVLGGLSLIGVPLTTGFVSKWYLVQALLSDGLWPVAVLVLVASVLAVAYIWRVVEVAWFHEPEGRAAEAREAPLSLLLPLWLLVLANLWFGVNTDLTVGVAGQAARALMGAAG